MVYALFLFLAGPLLVHLFLKRTRRQPFAYTALIEQVQSRSGYLSRWAERLLLVLRTLVVATCLWALCQYTRTDSTSRTGLTVLLIDNTLSTTQPLTTDGGLEDHLTHGRQIARQIIQAGGAERYLVLPLAGRQVVAGAGSGTEEALASLGAITPSMEVPEVSSLYRIVTSLDGQPDTRLMLITDGLAGSGPLTSVLSQATPRLEVLTTRAESASRAGMANVWVDTLTYQEGAGLTTGAEAQVHLSRNAPGPDQIQVRYRVGRQVGALTVNFRGGRQVVARIPLPPLADTATATLDLAGDTYLPDNRYELSLAGGERPKVYLSAGTAGIRAVTALRASGALQVEETLTPELTGGAILTPADLALTPLSQLPERTLVIPKGGEGMPETILQQVGARQQTITGQGAIPGDQQYAYQYAPEAVNSSPVRRALARPLGGEAQLPYARPHIQIEGPGVEPLVLLNNQQHALARVYHSGQRELILMTHSLSPEATNLASSELFLPLIAELLLPGQTTGPAMAQVRQLDRAGQRALYRAPEAERLKSDTLLTVAAGEAQNGVTAGLSQASLLGNETINGPLMILLILLVLTAEGALLALKRT